MSKDKLTKNDHFRAMLITAQERGFAPDCVAFDGWYSSLVLLYLLQPQFVLQSRHDVT
jgi:hypothetical protein